MSVQHSRVVSIILSTLLFEQANALPLEFGATVGDTSTIPNDDGSSTQFDLPFPMVFYDEINESVYQNTNGAITFQLPFSQFTPEIVPSSSIPPMVAAYWCDIDTRNGGVGINELFARVSTATTDLDNATAVIQSLGGTAMDFNPSALFVATWNNVEAFSVRVGEQNTFQLVMAWNVEQTYVILAYDKLEFFSTDTSTFAVVGFNDNLGVEGMLIDVIENHNDTSRILSNSNTGKSGVYAYRVDGGVDLTGCDRPMNQPRLSPQFGPQVGGTVLQIQNLPTCANENTTVFCRFERNTFSQVHQGVRVSDSHIECLTPYMGVESSIVVSYALHSSSEDVFNENTATWTEVSNRFQYHQSHAGAVIQNDVPQLLEAQTDYTIQWSSYSLLAEATMCLCTESNVTEPDISVALEVLATEVDPSEPSGNFRVIHTIAIEDINTNEASFTIPASAIEEFLFESQPDFFVAPCLVRIVAYSDSSLSRVAATRSTMLTGVLENGQRNLRELQGQCNLLEPSPLLPCTEDFDDLLPCPPTYQIAQTDSRYSDDEACTFPNGDAECGVELDFELDIALDVDFTCFSLGIERTSCQGILDLEVDFSVDIHASAASCACNFFHPGASGCVRSGGSQCCYSSSGGLITSPSMGAGTADCNAAEDFSIPHIINDVIPFVWCCKVLGGEACEEYYMERPVVTSEGYSNPLAAAIANGDPHLRTFDGVDYDFNGAGEYVAFCGLLGSGVVDVSEITTPCHPSVARLGQTESESPISIHYRFAPLNEGDVGTVTVAFAVHDPLHGRDAISVVPHPTRRVDVFNGSTRVVFPLTPTATTTFVHESGLTIERDTSTTETRLALKIITPSGLRVEGTEVNGVWVLSCSVPESFVGRSIGLLGRMDGNGSNDFTNSDGIVVDVDSSSEIIFNDFGQTWMIQDSASTLFQGLSDSAQAFEEFFAPLYVPTFEAPTLTAAQQEAADAACASASTETIRLGCVFDIAVTGDFETFGSVAAATQDQRTALVDVVENTLPFLNPPSISTELYTGGSASFEISATDADGDSLTYTLDVADDSRFVLAENGLSFLGSAIPGQYVAMVAISDGLGAVTFTATVNVVQSPAPTHEPTSAPSAEPTRAPVSPAPTRGLASPAPTHDPTSMPPTSTTPATPSPTRVRAETAKECKFLCRILRLVHRLIIGFQKFLLAAEYERGENDEIET